MKNANIIKTVPPPAKSNQELKITEENNKSQSNELKQATNKEKELSRGGEIVNKESSGNLEDEEKMETIRVASYENSSNQAYGLVAKLA